MDESLQPFCKVYNKHINAKCNVKSINLSHYVKGAPDWYRCKQQITLIDYSKYTECIQFACEPITQTYEFFTNLFITVCCHMRSIRKIYMCANYFMVNIPVEIQNLQLLRELSLTYNKITAVPDEIYHCTSLIKLKLNYNAITECPRKLPPNLRELNLGNNKITAVGDALQHLRSLCILKLNCNRLVEFPPLLPADLIYLDLGNNLIADMKCYLPKLCHLKLYNNQIMTVPTDILNMTALRELNLWNNRAVKQLHYFINCSHKYNPICLNMMPKNIIFITIYNDKIPHNMPYACKKYYLVTKPTIIAPKVPYKCIYTIRNYYGCIGSKRYINYT